MVEQSRDSRISAAFVKVADTLVADYDVVELLDTLIQECVALVDSDAGGLMIADAQGELQLIASSNDRVEFVEIHQLNAGRGPCVEAFETGQSISVGDIETESDRWPSFRDAALREGYKSVHSFPMRLRQETIGAMNLFGVKPGRLSASEASVAQALTDVATIGILQERTLRDTAVVAEQLQQALNSRILIEQAKGVVAAQLETDMDAAFAIIRAYARTNQLSLSTVAEKIAARALTIPVPTQKHRR